MLLYSGMCASPWTAQPTVPILRRRLGPTSHSGTRCLPRGAACQFASLPQWPRTPEQDREFQSALLAMGNLYGSLWKTTVLQHRTVPPKPAHAAADCVYSTMPYDERGWPTFEEGAALLAAQHRKRQLDDERGKAAHTPRRRASLASPRAHHQASPEGTSPGAASTSLDKEPSADILSEAESKMPKLIDISEGVPRPVAVRSINQVTLQQLTEHIESAHFTNGKDDRERVQQMLREFNTKLEQAARACRAASNSSMRCAARPAALTRAALLRALDLRVAGDADGMHSVVAQNATDFRRRIDRANSRELPAEASAEPRRGIKGRRNSKASAVPTTAAQMAVAAAATASADGAKQQRRGKFSAMFPKRASRASTSNDISGAPDAPEATTEPSGIALATCADQAEARACGTGGSSKTQMVQNSPYDEAVELSEASDDKTRTARGGGSDDRGGSAPAPSAGPTAPGTPPARRSADESSWPKAIISPDDPSKLTYHL